MRRRTYDEDLEAEKSVRSTPPRQPDTRGPEDEVLRLQSLAGNAAVNSLLEVQRKPEAAPAGKEAEQPSASLDVADVGILKVESYRPLSGGRGLEPPGGGGSGKASPGPAASRVLEITRISDKESPGLIQKAAKGDVISKVVLSHSKAGVLLELAPVMISGVAMAGAGPDGEPLETVTFEEVKKKE